jgi:RNA-binding protein
MIASTKLMSPTKVGEIGEIMHLAKSGRLIVKLNAAGASIRAGELLVDGSGKRVGRVAELIGPVSAPYASVIPMTDRTSRLVGAKIFNGGFAAKTSRSQGRGFGRRSR